MAYGVAVASIVAVLGIATAGPASGAAGSSGTALLPDLVVESPADIVLQRQDGSTETYLRFSHSTANTGVGPLEIYPDLTTDTCGEKGHRGRVAYQAIYEDGNSNGTFQRGIDTETTAMPVGCMIYHKIHEHYHFEDFARYELYRMETGRLVEVSKKVSFCVIDSHKYAPQLPGSPENPYYNFANCATDSGTHGISVGWADKYGAGTPGQEFNVSGRREGRFCLVTRADPKNRLTEIAPGGEDNNVESVQIRMSLKQATDLGRAVRVLDEPCSAPA